MKLSIIILSYNTKELLRTCLQSIFEQVKQVDYEVIVVDNASSDGSVETIKKEFKNIRVMENKDNYGFAKGCNIGVTQGKGEYLLFLNSDAEFVDNSLMKMIEFADTHKDVGVVGGKTGKQRSFGKFLTLSHVFLLLFAERFIGKQERNPNELQETDWVSGGFMLVRRSVFEQLHGFDEQIFMYIEDMEFCFRVKQAEYQVYYFPDASVKHLGQGSSNRSFAIVHIYQGLLYFYRKHKSHGDYLIVKNMLKLKALVAILIGTLTRNSYLTKTYKEALRFS